MTRVVIVGTGAMASQHAKWLQAIDGVQIVGGVDRDPERLAKFAAEFDIAHQFASIEDALAYGDFDAVTNATPDPVHHVTTLPFLRAGKHVMCEKPLATNAADAVEMCDIARQAGVVNMVNLTYRRDPAMQRAAQMVADGDIGQLRHFDASYLQSWLVQPAWGDWRTEQQWLWRLSTAHGSHGVLGDVGVHILDYLTYVARQGIADLSCRLKTFAKAEGDQIGDYTLDANDSAVIHVGLTGGAVGVVHATRFASGHVNDLNLRIHGTKGGLELGERNGVSYLRASTGDDLETGSWKDVSLGDDGRHNFVAFINAIRNGASGDPDFARGAQLQMALDLAVASDKQGGRILPMDWI